MQTSDRVACIAASIALSLCTTFILASLYVYSVRSARNELDRVSFRLLLLTMVFELVYGLSYIVLYSNAHVSIKTEEDGH